MNYESMSDFEINKLVAPLLNYLVQDINDDSMIGMNSKFHEQYPNTVWVAETDPITGEQVSAWEQKCFTRIADDAWPVMIENNIGVYAKSDSDYEIGMCNFTGCWCANGINSVDGEFGMAVDAFEFVDENPLRAAMIVFLMMNENK